MDKKQNKIITSADLNDEQWKEFLNSMSEEEQKRIFREEAKKFFSCYHDELIQPILKLKEQTANKDVIISMHKSEIERLRNRNKEQAAKIELLQQSNKVYRQTMMLNKCTNFLPVILSLIAVVLGSAAFWLTIK